MNPARILVNRINEYKQENNLSYEDLAKMVNIDVTTLRCFMFGKGKISGNQLMALATIVAPRKEESEEAAVK